MTLPIVYPSPQPMTIDTQREESPFANTMGSVEQRWTSEQIADFVRKLGFLGTEKERGDKIKLFLHLNSVSIISYVTINRTVCMLLLIEQSTCYYN